LPPPDHRDGAGRDQVRRIFAGLKPIKLIQGAALAWEPWKFHNSRPSKSRKRAAGVDVCLAPKPTELLHSSEM